MDKACFPLSSSLSIKRYRLMGQLFPLLFFTVNIIVNPVWQFVQSFLGGLSSPRAIC